MLSMTIDRYRLSGRFEPVLANGRLEFASANVSFKVSRNKNTKKNQHHAYTGVY